MGLELEKNDFPNNFLNIYDLEDGDIGLIKDTNEAKSEIVGQFIIKVAKAPTVLFLKTGEIASTIDLANMETKVTLVSEGTHFVVKND